MGKYSPRGGCEKRLRLETCMCALISTNSVFHKRMNGVRYKSIEKRTNNKNLRNMVQSNTIINRKNWKRLFYNCNGNKSLSLYERWPQWHILKQRQPCSFCGSGKTNKNSH